MTNLDDLLGHHVTLPVRRLAAAGVPAVVVDDGYADVLYNDFMAVVNQLQTDGFYKVGLINEDIS